MTCEQNPQTYREELQGGRKALPYPSLWLTVQIPLTIYSSFENKAQNANISGQGVFFHSFFFQELFTCLLGTIPRAEKGSLEMSS